MSWTNEPKGSTFTHSKGSDRATQDNADPTEETSQGEPETMSEPEES